MQNDLTIDGFKISTWESELGEPPFHAVNMSVAIERLEGCDLSEEEKTDLMELMAGYCNLLIDLKLVGFGQTEFEAIKDLFSHAVLADS